MAECLTVNTQYQKEPKAYNEPFYVPLALLIFTHNLSLLSLVHANQEEPNLNAQK